MKKIILTFALIVCVGASVNAQPAQTHTPEAALSAKSEKETNIITETSVGPFVLGQKMPTTIPGGAFYTSVKKMSYDKYSGTTYELYDGDTKVGYVITHPTKGTITKITTLTPKTATADGIAVGMPLQSAITLSNVKIEIEYYYDADSWAIDFKRGNIHFYASESEFFYGVTKEANDKINNGFYSGNPIYKLTPKDFDPEVTVSEIQVSL